MHRRSVTSQGPSQADIQGGSSVTFHYIFHVFFLSGCQQLRWGSHLNVNFSTKGRRVKAQLSFLLFLAERDPICGQKCYCRVGYNCFQWNNPHNFRTLKGSIRTCKYIAIQVFGVVRVSYFTLNPLLTFVYYQFP